MTFAGPIGHWVVDEVKDGWGCSVKLQVGDRQLVRLVVKLCPLESDCST